MAKRKSASKQSAKQLVEVTLRRLAKPAGSGKVGEYALLLSPKVYGSTGKNWLGGRTFPTKEAAIEAAPKLGGRVAA